VRARATGAGIVMENEFLLLRIDRRGEIAELYDKQADRQVVPRGQTMNRLEFYRDNPAAWDAWDIDISYKSTPVSLPPAEGVALTAAGPLEARVAVRRRLGGSVLRQEVVLRHASRRIDFPTWVDWRETHRLLKVAFPADLKAPVLRGEIQFGHVVRPTHRNYEFERQRFEWPAQKWADASEANFGVALMNDCKYGYDFLEGVLRLTLLRAPILPDPTADRRRHEFVYALYVHDGGFAESEVVRQGYDLNLPAVVTPGSAGATAFAEVSARAVICETVKRSQDDRATVLRLYESLGGSARTSLRCPAAGGRAWECDMLEAPLRRLAVGRGGEITLRFRPFEVKTIRWE
jgi:alpha-mannosidase